MKVVALEEGHDGRFFRKPGDKFDVADDVLDLRIRKNGVDIHGRPLGDDFHPISDWFEPVDESDKKRIKGQHAEAHALLNGDPVPAKKSAEAKKAKAEGSAELV